MDRSKKRQALTEEHPAVSFWPLLRRMDQAVVAALLAGSLMGLAVLAYRHQRGGYIDFDRDDPPAISFQVDVNRADTNELELLPAIGEALAQRIIETRDARGPFRTHDELRRVNGIGPKTLDQIRPFLLPIADSDRQAEQPRK